MTRLGVWGRGQMARKGDRSKTIIVDPQTRYYGATLKTRSLVTPD